MQTISDIRLTSNGRFWQAVWTDHGERRRRNVGSKKSMSKLEASRRVRSIIANGEIQSVPDGGIPDLASWCNVFLAQRPMSDSTRKLYDVTIRRLTAFFGDPGPTIDKITPAHAADWLSSLTDGTLSTRHLSSNTVRRHVREAKAVFNEAVEQEYIERNPFRKLRSTTEKLRKRWAYITDEQMADILQACPNRSYRLLFALCRWAGLRRNEAIGITPAAINFKTNQLEVHRELAAATTKKAHRILPIEPERRPTGLATLLRREGTINIEDLGRIDGMHRALIRVIKAAGVDVYSKPLHTLRKNWETDLAQHYPQYVVSEWLGHDMAVSADHYLKVPEEFFNAPNTKGNHAKNRAD